MKKNNFVEKPQFSDNNSFVAKRRYTGLKYNTEVHFDDCLVVCKSKDGVRELSPNWNGIIINPKDKVSIFNTVDPNTFDLYFINENAITQRWGTNFEYKVNMVEKEKVYFRIEFSFRIMEANKFVKNLLLTEVSHDDYSKQFIIDLIMNKVSGSLKNCAIDALNEYSFEEVMNNSREVINFAEERLNCEFNYGLEFKVNQLIYEEDSLSKEKRSYLENSKTLLGKLKEI